MREEKNSLIKKAWFMLNFLNLKSFPSYLFFVSSSIQPQHTVYQNNRLNKRVEREDGFIYYMKHCEYCGKISNLLHEKLKL